MSEWKMPAELEQYRSFFSDLGPLSIEYCMTHFNSKSTDILIQAGEQLTPEALSTLEKGVENQDLERLRQVRTLLCNVQVRMVVALRAAGLLKDPPPCPLQTGEKRADG